MVNHGECNAMRSERSDEQRRMCGPRGSCGRREEVRDRGSREAEVVMAREGRSFRDTNGPPSIRSGAHPRQLDSC